MGLFDWYEPVPALSCPRCARPLGEWQGKDAQPSFLWVWRQGHAAPVDHRVDPEHHSLPTAVRLPPRFEIYTTCSSGHPVDALGEAPGGTWSRTTLISAPVPPRRGANARWSCPCCGCFTLDDEPPGSLQTCPVCGWEDDAAQFADPDLVRPKNVRCLRHARRTFVVRGLSDPEHQARVRPPRPDELE